jgi:V8-like Glu-specific endopeptidase
MQWPYSTIGFIKSDIGNATGTLVGKNFVLTCATVVYNRKDKKKVNR